MTVEEVCFALQEFWECAVEETEARTFLDRLAELGLIEVLESGKRYRVPASGIGSILLDAIDDVERYAHRALEEMGRG